MENSFIFRIKRPIVLPVNQYANEGSLVYNTRDFGFGYSIIPNPREKVMTISLLVFRIADEVVIRTLATFNVTEQGFITSVVLNQADIDKAVSNRADINAHILESSERLMALRAEEAALAEAGESTVEISATIEALMTQISKYLDDLNAITIPQAEYLYVNKYSDIINYFDKDGSITEAGIEWAKTVPFLGATLNDYLA